MGALLCKAKGVSVTFDNPLYGADDRWSTDGEGNDLEYNYDEWRYEDPVYECVDETY